MIAALFRRIRHRKTRRQIRWALGYIQSRYGHGHDAARQQALQNWKAMRP